MSKELYDKGLAVRKDVLGSDYVERQLKTVDDFNGPLQEMVTEYCWGWLWTRPQIPRKTRSLLNLAILSALNRPAEFKTHVKGALKNGCSKDEIREVLLQVAVYCGVPAGVEAFRLAREVFSEGEKRA
jgi:4-carboxymuconolactone decarboxylase